MVGAISYEVGIGVDTKDADDALIRVIARADKPIALKQILQGFTNANRPVEEVALQQLRRHIEHGRLFEFPAIRGIAYFWDRSPAEYAKQLLTQRAARIPESKATILREVGKLAPLKGVSKVELERQFKSLLQEGRIQENPPLLGTRTSLYSTQPPRASEYVADALERLARKLNRPVQTLFAEYQSDALSHDWSSHSSEQDATFAKEQVAAPESTNVSDERMLEAMLDLNPRVASGDLVSIAALRRQLETALPGSEFDREVLRESAAGRLSLHRFDRPALISEAERSQLLCDERGHYYNAVSLRSE